VTVWMIKKKQIRVLIGDLHPIFRSGLRYLLSRESSISVVGEVDDSKQILKMVSTRKPTILILDSLLTEGNGQDFLQELQQKHKKVRVILLTATKKDEDFLRDFRTKTAGLVSKQAAFVTLVQCIRKVDSGGVWTNGDRLGSSGIEPLPTSASAAPVKDNVPLSFREKQVVSLVSQGYRNKEIAERMFISEQTVKNHLHNIFDKLGISDRLELALYAIHRNLQVLE